MSMKNVSKFPKMSRKMMGTPRKNGKNSVQNLAHNVPRKTDAKSTSDKVPNMNQDAIQTGL